jgi:SnoaL-like domain
VDKDDWDGFRQDLDEAQRQWNLGNVKPLKALWSHQDDCSIFGGFGGLEKGWQVVGSRLEWAAQQVLAQRGVREFSREVLVENVAAGTAYTVEIESSAYSGGIAQRRVTQIYRHEPAGWRILHRHADVVGNPPARARGESGATNS